MAKCFVIQPFDGGKFDKRYRDCIEPAIRTAGFQPYRVDGDINTDVPVSAIEDGIASADACVADITVDNPNVWLEVGLAIAHGRPLVLICEETRTTLPFDVRHRQVIFYKSDSISDFHELQEKVTARLQSFKRTGRRRTSVGPQLLRQNV